MPRVELSQDLTIHIAGYPQGSNRPSGGTRLTLWGTTGGYPIPRTGTYVLPQRVPLEHDASESCPIDRLGMLEHFRRHRGLEMEKTQATKRSNTHLVNSRSGNFR